MLVVEGVWNACCYIIEREVSAVLVARAIW